MNRMTTVVLITALLTALVPPLAAEEAPACPLEQLSQRLSRPTKAMKRTEMPVTERRSTESGTWIVYRDGSDVVRRIERADYGEMGKRVLALVRLRTDAVAIREIDIDYAEPINPAKPVRIAQTRVRDYFFCGAVTYLPIDTGDPQSATYAAREAKYLRATFFSSMEIRAFLDRAR